MKITTEITSNMLEQQKKTLFFCPKKALAKGRSPPQELEERPRNGMYLLVYIIWNTFILFYILTPDICIYLNNIPLHLLTIICSVYFVLVVSKLHQPNT